VYIHTNASRDSRSNVIGLTDEQLATLTSLLSAGGVPTKLAAAILKVMIPAPALLARCAVDERHSVAMIGEF
jgi:hypothetical protein